VNADPVRAAGFREKLQAAYTTLRDMRSAEYLTGYGTKGHGNFIWQYVHQFGPLVQVKALLEETELGKVFFPDLTIHATQVIHADMPPGPSHEDTAASVCGFGEDSNARVNTAA
jgi:hypothetical protein